MREERERKPTQLWLVVVVVVAWVVVVRRPVSPVMSRRSNTMRVCVVRDVTTYLFRVFCIVRDRPAFVE